MESVTGVHELDDWIWAQIQPSQHPQDFIDFAAHARGRQAPIEQALDSAMQLQHPGDAVPLAPGVLVQLERWADEGQLASVMAAARWRLLGLGCEADHSAAMRWLDHGITLGYASCMTYKARILAASDVDAARPWFERAIQAGDTSAHAHWVDTDDAQTAHHLAIALQAGVSYAFLVEGDHLIRKDDEASVNKGIDLLRTAAEANQADACHLLGLHFWKGAQEDQRETDTAAQWLRKGARLGNPACMASLGRLLCNTGHTGQTGDARRYLTWAALLGDERGQQTLGSELLLNGATPEDHAEGVHWLRQSAQQGYLPAMRLLGWSLYEGRGCTAQPEEAVEWFTRGADRGDAECQTYLGCANANGIGTAKDPTRAHELFHLGSLQGHARATALLGQTYVDGLGTEVDIPRAMECFRAAAEHREASAAFALGRIYLSGRGTRRDYAAAARWLRDAAQWGSTAAKTLLGLMLLHGEGVDDNPKAAARWLREAAHEGDATAMRTLAQMLMDGNGVTADEDEARRLMTKAAALDDDEAKAWVQKNCPEQPQWLRDLVQWKPQAPFA